MAAGVLTLPRLLLGEALKRLRVDGGKTLDEVAETIGKSRARLINVLEGKGTLTADELRRLLDFLDATPQQKHELLALGAEARKRPTRRPYTDLLPSAYERQTDLQTMATEINWYERGVIPGLLQVPEYLDAMATENDGLWFESSWEVRRNYIVFQRERQKVVFEANPAKTMRFVITDDALRTEVGGAHTMERQLRHLVNLIDERPNITIQVLSSTAAHNPAPSAGLIVLRLGGASHTVGFLPVAFGPSTYLDDPADTDRLARAFARIQRLAMGAAESRDLIAGLANTL